MFSTFGTSFTFGRRKKKAVATFPNGLIVHLQNPTSSSWTDSVSNLTATISGTVTYSATGGGFVTLDNTCYILLPYNLVRPFTVSIITSQTPNSYGQNPAIWANEEYDALKGYYLGWNNASQLLKGTPTQEGPEDLPAGFDKTVVNMYDWAIGDGGAFDTTNFYLNGNLRATGSVFPPQNGAATNNFLMNARHQNDGTIIPTPRSHSQGSYYNLQIYNTALSSTDITSKYNYMKTIYALP